MASFFVDGADLFDAVALALRNAKTEICITDWMLSPEVRAAQAHLTAFNRSYLVAQETGATTDQAVG